MNYNVDFVKRKMDKWSNYIMEFDLPEYKNLPTIGLYMDQVITLLHQYLGYLPNSNDKNAESFITANAINNYVRLAVMPAPIKKKYYANHIAYMIMICVLKPSLSISDISQLIPSNLSEEELRSTYDKFTSIHKKSSVKLISHLQEIAGTPENVTDVIELIVTSAINTSLCKRFTEKMSALNGLENEEAEKIKRSQNVNKR
ncbi:MAG: DUF1836 domain-containing protein [Lachnospiraceae bacterium]|nr:DUF1836 domain-containing protein [Lachnospiraceae bacterium]